MVVTHNKVLKMKKLSLFIVLSLTALQIPFAQNSEGRIDNIHINSKATAHNIIGDDASQEVAVYLPPSYQSQAQKRYPVLYFLPGYYDKVKVWTTEGHFQGFKLQESMDSLIVAKAIKEMIVVIPNSYTFLEGSFYTNSSVNGNYETFYTQELIQHIDSKYRTLASHKSRAIAGHSMGGSGALFLSMKYPDLYSIGYGLCSGLFADNWLEECLLFTDTAQIRRYIALEKRLSGLSRAEAHSQYMQTMQGLEWWERFMYAYGTAFAPDKSKNAPYIQFPYYLNNNDSLIVDQAAMERWEEGFGNLEEKVDQYKRNLKRLKAYVIDYGKHDYFKYICPGNASYHNLLNQKNIPHTYVVHDGDHANKVRQQIENAILPLCSEMLEFE